MGKKRAKTQAEIAYKKELKRIQAYVRKYQQKGVFFSEDIIPPKPKKITEGSVRRLKAITPETLMQKGYAIDPESGEFYQGRSQIIDYIKTANYISAQPTFYGGDFASKIKQRNEAIKSDLEWEQKQSEAEYEANVRHARFAQMVNQQMEERRMRLGGSPSSYDDFAEYTEDTYTQADTPPNLADEAIYGVSEMIEKTGVFTGSLTHHQEHRYGAVMEVLRSSIAENGRRAVAQSIEEAGAEFKEIVETIIYKGYSGEIYTQEMTRLARIVKKRPLSLEEAQKIGMEMDENEDEEGYE